MRTTVIINSLKCDDCKNKVVAAINEVDGFSNIIIDIATGSLSLDFRSHNAFEGLRLHLSEIGHPITKDPNVIRESSTKNHKFKRSNSSQK